MGNNIMMNRTASDQFKRKENTPTQSYMNKYGSPSGSGDNQNIYVNNPAAVMNRHHHRHNKLSYQQQNLKNISIE